MCAAGRPVTKNCVVFLHFPWNLLISKWSQLACVTVLISTSDIAVCYTLSFLIFYQNTHKQHCHYYPNVCFIIIFFDLPENYKLLMWFTLCSLSVCRCGILSRVILSQMYVRCSVLLLYRNCSTSVVAHLWDVWPGVPYRPALTSAFTWVRSSTSTHRCPCSLLQFDFRRGGLRLHFTVNLWNVSCRWCH